MGALAMAAPIYGGPSPAKSVPSKAEEQTCTPRDTLFLYHDILIVRGPVF